VVCQCNQPLGRDNKALVTTITSASVLFTLYFRRTERDMSSQETTIKILSLRKPATARIASKQAFVTSRLVCITSGDYEGINLYLRPWNPNVAAESRCSFHFKCPPLHLSGSVFPFSSIRVNCRQTQIVYILYIYIYTYTLFSAKFYIYVYFILGKIYDAIFHLQDNNIKFVISTIYNSIER